MITIDMLLMGRAKVDDLPPDIRQNLGILLRRINRIEQRFIAETGKNFRVNDGYRRPQDQPKNAATKSRHLTGQAVDIDDDDTAYVWEWCRLNLRLIADNQLWMEDPRWTHGSIGTWLHFQIVPPASGNRIFRPSSAPASAPNLWDGQYDSKLNLGVVA